jgi:UDP:flavonoid glycosyltransferase YjiC (YdhE family)
VSVIAAAASAVPAHLPANVWCAEYLPGIEAARRARLVIANGGSPTVQQALAAGKPVLGLPANLDQHLNMDYVTRAGAGKTIRSEAASAGTIREAVRELLATPGYAQAAERLADRFSRYDPGAVVAGVVNGAGSSARS